MRQNADKWHKFNFANLEHFKGFSTNFFLISKTWVCVRGGGGGGEGLVIIIFLCWHCFLNGRFVY